MSFEAVCCVLGQVILVDPFQLEKIIVCDEKEVAQTVRCVVFHKIDASFLLWAEFRLFLCLFGSSLMSCLSVRCH